MKKILTFLTILSFFLSVSACSKGSDYLILTRSEDMKSLDEMEERSYSECFYPLPDGYSLSALAELDGKLLLLGRGEDDFLVGSVDYSVSQYGRVSLSVFKPFTLPDTQGEDQMRIYDITAGGDGRFYLLTGSPEEYMPQQYSVLMYSAEGEFLGKMSIPNWTDGKIKKLHVGYDGEIIFRGKSYLCRYSREGKQLCRVWAGGECILSSALCKDGVIFSLLNDRSKSPYYIFDYINGEIKSLQLSNPYEVNSYEYVELYMGSIGNCQGMNGEYIINTGGRLMLCNFRIDSFMELSRSGTLGDVCRIGERCFAMVSDGYLIVSGIEYVDK